MVGEGKQKKCNEIKYIKEIRKCKSNDKNWYFSKTIDTFSEKERAYKEKEREWGRGREVKEEEING